ncbi:uncharacterized protein LDX57_004862 [Aspergillus melleus]|uniref:uncharacterized protein n=1 Tax=Aspergillus melleus TaxID=138277 RepID=UPI001E8D2E63|nr:uncharacterized protein LDX57_004862 [Aspergillus melleus]KAH8427145.1 hypothetical protein LDX57_004862 [Aspergillus melleus]
MRADPEFFAVGFVGEVIDFANPDSHWILTERLRERHAQLIAEEVNERPWACSAAYGTFRAKNVDDETQEAFIRIVMQINYVGGEIASDEERASRAVQSLPENGQEMLDALALMEQAQCRSAPRLLGVSSRIQALKEPVPGGFFTCLLLEKLPGQKIGPWFWELDLGQRDHIRARFKEAWLECAAIAKYRVVSAPSKVFWDDTTQRIAFYDFLTGCREDDPIRWKDVYFILFGLAKAPPQYRMWGKHTESSSTEGWTF